MLLFRFLGTSAERGRVGADILKKRVLRVFSQFRCPDCLTSSQ